MPTIQLITILNTTPGVAFDLARDLDLHVESMAGKEEKITAGRSGGLIELGESVTWQGRHFGIVQQHTSIISQFNYPHHFRDEMTEGRFAHFIHDHYFEPVPAGTKMIDVIDFRAPCGVLGRVVEWGMLTGYLKKLMAERNRTIARVARQKWIDGGGMVPDHALTVDACKPEEIEPPDNNRTPIESAQTSEKKSLREHVQHLITLFLHGDENARARAQAEVRIDRRPLIRKILEDASLSHIAQEAGIDRSCRALEIAALSPDVLPDLISRKEITHDELIAILSHQNISMQEDIIVVLWVTGPGGSYLVFYINPYELFAANRYITSLPVPNGFDITDVPEHVDNGSEV